jgi:hypothetical protein
MKKVFVVILLFIVSMCFAGDFELVNIIDEFDDETGDIRMVASFEGKFANSATDNSDLFGFVMQDFPFSQKTGFKTSPNFYLKLYEYGHHRVEAFNPLVVFSIKDSTGKKIKAEKSYKYDTGTFEIPPVISNIFTQEGNIKIVVSIYERSSDLSYYYGTSTYSFQLNCEGVNVLFQDIKTKHDEKYIKK